MAKKGSTIIDLRKWRPESKKNSRHVREHEDRPKLTLRQRRRRIQALWGLLYLTIAVGIVWASNQISYHPRLSINRVTVTGAKEVSPNLVRSYFESKLYDGTYHFFSRANIFFYPKISLAHEVVAGIPRIQSAKISRDALLAQAITVTVVEREPYGRWCASSEQCYFFDAGGFIFAQAPAESALLVFRGGLATSTANPIGQTFLPNHIAELRPSLSFLSQKGYAPQRVDVIDANDFEILLSEGFVVRASFGDDPDVLVRNLELILASAPLRGNLSNIEYVDLRFGNRVYYKLKGSAQQEAAR